MQYYVTQQTTKEYGGRFRSEVAGLCNAETMLMKSSNVVQQRPSSYSHHDGRTSVANAPRLPKKISF